MEKEIYVPIDGFPNYEISNYGNIKKLNTTSIAGIKRNYKEKILKPYKHNNKAYIVLKDKNNKQISKLVAKLVAELFIEIPNNYKFVKNCNGDIFDNSIYNLQWVETVKEVIYIPPISFKDKFKNFIKTIFS